MATYNGEKFIAHQLNSILLQLDTDDELIVSDDNSTDATIDIINNFNDNRIQLYINEGEKGTARNFENALKRANGEFIFLADQDDLWLPSKKEFMLGMLQHCDIAVTDASIIDDKGNIIVKSYFDKRGSGPGFIKNFWKNSYLGCCMAFKRAVLLPALPLPSKVIYHDYWLGLNAELFFKTRFEKEVFTFYRRHENNASTAAFFMRNKSLTSILRMRALMAIVILKRALRYSKNSRYL